MAARMVFPFRFRGLGSGRHMSALTGRLEASGLIPKMHCERFISTIARSFLVRNNINSPALTCMSTSTKVYQSESQSQKKEQQALSEDHPLSDIDDPFKETVQPCILCKNQVPLSYKNVQLLSQFVSPNTGRIYGRHITKLCNYQQKRVTKAVKRARHMGFMPVMYRETIFLQDPNLFDVRYTGSIDIAMQEPSNLVQPESQDADEDDTDLKK